MGRVAFLFPVFVFNFLTVCEVFQGGVGRRGCKGAGGNFGGSGCVLYPERDDSKDEYIQSKSSDCSFKY